MIKRIWRKMEDETKKINEIEKGLENRKYCKQVNGIEKQKEQGGKR